MTFYDSFDCKINCEEFSPVGEEEREEVFRIIAQENEAIEGFQTYLDSLESTERVAALEQLAFEQRESKRKDWLKGYSPQAGREGAGL
jgi:hypothetical protein